MSGNIKFRWFLIAPLLVVLFVCMLPNISMAGELEDAEERVRQNPNDADTLHELGKTYFFLGQIHRSIFFFRQAIRIKPDHADAHNNLGVALEKTNEVTGAIKHTIIAIELNKRQNNFEDLIKTKANLRLYLEKHRLYRLEDFANIQIPRSAKYNRQLNAQETITFYTNIIRDNPYNIEAHIKLGLAYEKLSNNDEAIASYKEALKIDRYNNVANYELRRLERKIAKEKVTQEHTAEGKKLDTSQSIQGHNELARKIELLEKERKELREERNKLDALRLAEKNRQLEEERKKLEEERKKLEALRLGEEEKQRQAQAEKAPPPQDPKKQTPQSGSGSGFFVSKLGHVITNAHVVKGCNRVTVGDNANKQVAAEIINTDRTNDLALLKLSTLEMASAESKSLIQKLSIVVVPLASKGLLRSEDVRLGEKVLVAGFPFGDFFSNSIKVTSGIVSSTRGAGDDSGQFQLDAAIQPGNSGGPIYDSSGNIVGVVISQLDKRKVEKAIGSLPENVNFGIKASTVRQFLTSSGLPSKKSERTEEKSTEQLAEIAKNQALMVMCLQ